METQENATSKTQHSDGTDSLSNVNGLLSSNEIKRRPVKHAKFQVGEEPKIFASPRAAIPGRHVRVFRSMSHMTRHAYREDLLKCCLSAAYLILVMLLLSHFLVLVHYRMPKNEFWHNVRPLPDIILDWIPLHEGGFLLAEIIINCLSFLTFTLVVFHSHSLILLRRMFCISANVYLLRCFCVIATSLPPSNINLTSDCEPTELTSVSAFVAQALRIFLGMGMRSTGGATCGDYVYSGHTCSLTLFNLFILKYSPSSLYFLPLKMMSFLLNIAGMVAILVAHEHYSVDVLLAFAITYLVFSEYHHVAHHVQLAMKQSSTSGEYHCCWQQRIKSPLTYFMENRGDGSVNNRLRIPFLDFYLTK